MAKNTTQGAFDFFGEEEQPQPKQEVVRKKPLRPPAQITVEEEASEEEALPITVAPEPEAMVEHPLLTASPIIEEEEIVPPTFLSFDVEEDQVLIPEEIAATTTDEIDTEEAEYNEPLTVVDLVTETIVPQHKRPPGVRGRKSVRENSIDADLVVMPPDEELFKKQYYSMGEVTALFKENHSLIRYWEKEFSILKPKKNGKGDRFFRPVDVKNLALIYDLLRRRKFTIEGAKDYLKNMKQADEKFAAVQSLQKIKAFFLELRANI